jgi:hypothetical protein
LLGFTSASPLNLAPAPHPQQLALGFNDISGTIPECVIRAPSLAELYVGNNNVQGPLPDAFEGANLKLLYVLDQMDRTLNGEQASSLACLVHAPLRCTAAQ